ncbi:MAG TPA: hypothetical protein VN943_17835 [Candidatus Acidoferrum sp.]|nr:hypothetical protein [Candidatus Acidoferrum sp.]
MKMFAAVFVMAGALLVPIAGAAQGPELTVKKEAKGRTPPAPVTAPLCVGTAFNAILSDGIDTRRARPGDVVTAEVAEDVSYQRTVIFPKGTKVIGHIVRATSGGHGRAGSALFVQFDKALLKDGQEVILNAGIQALAVGAVAPLSDTDGRGSRDAATSAALNPPAEQGAEGAEPALTASTNDALIVSTIYDTPRRGLRPPLFAAPAAEGELNSDGMFTPDSKGAFGRPDVKVYTPTSEGSHGTVLLSAKKNMHLDSGTRLLLVVQPPPNAELDASPTIDLSDIPPDF